MGLAAAKNRRKLSQDPNNNRWSKNSDSFGQRILRAHGWQPGQYLGAKDAPHAEWHTAANASHIRVILREDNLGLGAKRNRGDECTGLGAFQDLLGRLNGKSDEALENERKVREEVKLGLYMQNKIGLLRFVRGGWLVGDQVQEEAGPESARDTRSEEIVHVSEPETTEPCRANKRQRSEEELDAIDLPPRRRKSKRRKVLESDNTEVMTNHSPKSKNQKRSRKQKSSVEELDAEVAVSTDVKRTDDKIASPECSKEKSRKDKKEKRLKRNVDGREEIGDGTNGSELAKEKPSKAKKKKVLEENNGFIPADTSEHPKSATASLISTPAQSGTSTPIAGQISNRHLARSRFIAQKRMAVMDPQALNQIFMIKS